MTVCVVTGYQCVCQPDEAMWCPDYEPDRYVQYLMAAIVELRATPAAEAKDIDATRKQVLAHNYQQEKRSTDGGLTDVHLHHLLQGLPSMRKGS